MNVPAIYNISNQKDFERIFSESIKKLIIVIGYSDWNNESIKLNNDIIDFSSLRKKSIFISINFSKIEK